MATADNIILTQDGSHSILSPQFGVSYHSKYGAVQESKHVFIEAALFSKLIVQKNISILDIGFGTGLNAFITFLETFEKDGHINYTAVEAFPLAREIINRLNYPSILKAEDKAAVFTDMHTSPWDIPHKLSPNFILEKRLTQFENIKDLNTFDIIYFDAFAPSSQPELWEEAIFENMYNALRPNGILTTYCAKGIVKRRLKNVGFTVESLPGPPGKREMTKAVKISN